MKHLAKNDVLQPYSMARETVVEFLIISIDNYVRAFPTLVAMIGFVRVCVHLLFNFNILKSKWFEQTGLFVYLVVCKCLSKISCQFFVYGLVVVTIFRSVSETS